MIEDKKDKQKDQTAKNELSIIYVRKKVPKIMKTLGYAKNIYDKRKVKLIKHSNLKIFQYKTGRLKRFNDMQESSTSQNKTFSVPELSNSINQFKVTSHSKSLDNIFYRNRNYFKSDFLVYIINKLQYQNPEYYFLHNPVLKIYRCQLNTNEESCCCSCNSDAMFEVMKSLYDCYKKKDCDNCNCILCGHLPREERRLGEQRKSGVSVAKVEDRKSKKSKEKVKRKISSLEGKTAAEKEQILSDLIKSGAPLPEPKTKSDKELIKKLQAELGRARAVSEEVTPIDTKKIPSDKLKKLKESGLLTPLEGKSPEQKEKILRGLAMNGIPLPKGKTESEKKLIDKVRKDVGLPPEPKTASDKKKYDKAMAQGLITPLLGKSATEKEKILKGQADLGLTLPEGRTPSEQKLINEMKVAKAEPSSLKIPSAKLRKSKAESILTPLQGKTPEEKEKVIKDLVMKGIPLPEGKSVSDKKLIDKIRTELGLPPQPKSSSSKEKYAKAQAAGLIVPLEGKSEPQKEKLLKEQAKLGLSLPEGRTPSEKALIAKVKAETPAVASIPSDKIKSAKGTGLLTPLQGKTPEQKETILKGLAMRNIPLPEPKTPSEKLAIDKVHQDLGLPPQPKSKKEISNYNKAAAAGLITPLEGKSQAEKEKILQGQADLGLQLPEGRSPSEKALIDKIKSQKKKYRDKAVEGILPPDKRQKLDEKTRKNLKEGKGPSDECICSLISPESDKSIELKSKATITKDIKPPPRNEKLIRELAMQGAPLPEPKSHSEKKIIDKVQADLGLPPVPTTPSLKEKYAKAQKAGVLVPLEGKTPSQKEIILKKQAELGIPLPEGRTPSEKALVNKIRTAVRPESVVSEKLRKAKEAGLLTPLAGKSPEEQKRILRNIAKAGLPLPEGKSPSEKQIIQKVKDDMGLPSKGVPSEVLRKAKAAGLITPLGDKSPEQKEKILRDRLAMGLPLPDGVTPSDKQLIKKIKTSPGYTSPKLASAKVPKTKSADLLKSLEGKTPSQKEKILEQHITAGLPLPEGKTKSQKELIKKVQAKKLEGKTASQKEKILRSEKALTDKMRAKEKVSREIKPLSEKIKLAKAAGLLTPLEGKSPEQKEKVLKGLAKAGIPLPEGKTSSEKKLIEKVREEMGLPPEPKTSSMKNKMQQAHLAGIITPLEGKTPTEKEKILRKMQENGIPLPKGRTASEKSLIKKIKADMKVSPRKEPSSKIEKPKTEDLSKLLEGKTPAQKEKAIREIVKSGRPLPEGKTPSEKALINKIKAEKGLILSPEKVQKLDKKTAKVMKEGKGPSDECICHILSPEATKEKSVEALRTPSEKLRKAKEAGTLTPLQGKSAAEKEKILKGLAMQGIPLPEAKTASDKKLINKVRADLGLPPEPKTPSLKEKYNKAMAAGVVTPLQGKSSGQKEKILKAQAQMGLPLPEGRTPSEKALIEQIKATTPPLSKVHLAPEKALKAKVSLGGKSPEEKEKILRNLAMQGVPLPEGKTTSEKKIINKVRADVGLPPEPKTPSLKEKYNKAMAAGVVTPLQGKSSGQKEKILKAQAQMGLPLPEGRTPSEKALIEQIKATTPPLSKVHLAPEKALKAKVSLGGKSPEEKEKILRNLAMQGVPLPEGKTTSEKKIINKVRADLGLPPEPKTPSLKEKYNKAMAAGVVTPLQGKSSGQKEKILKAQAQMGLPLPEGRTPSEKALIEQIKKTTPPLSKPRLAPEKMLKAKVSLEGKSPEEKEKILKNLAMQGIPLPEAKTSSDKKLMEKIRADIGLPPEPKTKPEKDKYDSAVAAGIITPLQGKSPSQKEKILRRQAEMGLNLPKPRSASEKAIIDKIKTTAPAAMPEPLEKIQKAKAPSRFPSLEGKTPKEKENIIKELAMRGNLPEPKTASEKKLVDKVRAELGLPPEPLTPSIKEKYIKAKNEGLITPLQGKSASQKEKILRGQAELGLPLPEGRTPSEKNLIKKIKETVQKPAPTTKPTSVMSARKIAQLDKKTAKVVKEGKGPSDECICSILSPETKKEKSAEALKIPPEKLGKAKEAGLLKAKVSLAGKSPEEKEKILRNLAMQGVPLPEGKTTSEKKIIDKIRADVGLPPEPKTKSTRKLYDKAMAAGYISPLQGKTPAQKESILRRQAELGLPLPEGRTATEKDLIAKIKQKVPSKQDKEKIAGLLTPLEGKPLEKKEKILKSLAEAGLPLPEGKTASEKALIQKVKTEYEKPSKARIMAPGEKKSKIKTKSKKIAVATEQKSAKKQTKTKGAITEEFEDIIKTTTCDRGCGCDKKKIRFKHSYVKIRVTSPDISSLCPCPEECLPGVKGGVFTDNEGIKVTVGRAIGTPSFLSDVNLKLYKTFSKPTYPVLSTTKLSSRKIAASVFDYYYDYDNRSSRDKSQSETKLSKRSRYLDEIYQKYYNIYSFDRMEIESDIDIKHINLPSFHEFSVTNTSHDTSFESIYLLNRNSSLSLVTLPNSISVDSFSTTDSSLSSSFYEFKQDLRDYEIIKNYSFISSDENMRNNAVEPFKYSAESKTFGSGYNVCMFEVNKADVINSLDGKYSSNKKSSVTLDKVKTYLDVQELLCRLLSREQLYDTSSLIIVVSSSSDEHNLQYDQSILSSTIGLDVLEKNCSWNYKAHSLLHLHQNQRGFKITTAGKTINNNFRPTVNDNHGEKTNSQYKNEKQNGFYIKDHKERKHRTLKIKENCRIISTDTTQDRPCCCEIEDTLDVPSDLCQGRMDSIVTEIVTPIILKEADAQGLCHEAFINSNKKLVCQKRLPVTHSKLEIPTDQCSKVPFHRHQTQTCDSGNVLLSENNTNNTLKTCECDPQKLIELFNEKTKEMLSKACNISYDKLLEKNRASNQILSETPNSSRELCSSCAANNNSSETKKKLCPCEQNQKFPEDNYIEDQRNKKCKCKEQKSLKKNIICECPEEPEPEIDLSEWIDEKQMRKLQSELTQTRSGFKINKPRKKKDLEKNDLDMGFEEILKYIADNLEEESNKYNKDACACSNNIESKSKNITNCECPYEEPPPQTEPTPEEEPFSGIKFHISGKGSGSKGLNGILCFELLNDFSKKIKFDE